jgi:hypothetical protein
MAGTLVLPAGTPRLEIGYTAPALRGPERLKKKMLAEESFG